MSDIEDNEADMSGFSDDSLFDANWSPKGKDASSSDSEVMDDNAPMDIQMDAQMETQTDAPIMAPQMDAGDDSDCSNPPPDQGAVSTQTCEPEIRVYMCPPQERTDAVTDADSG